MAHRRSDPANELDLTIERTIDATPQQLWKAWSDPKLFCQWWCPKPWTTKVHQLELRPGGALISTMHGPDGEEVPCLGCFLEVRENERVIFTDALLGGYRPSAAPFITAIIDMRPVDGKTVYTVRVLHNNPEALRKHEEMGFHEGWGIVITQLEALARTLDC